MLSGWRIEIVATDLSHGGAGEGQGRHLQPVRGAARPADPDAGEILHADRRTLADHADIRAMVQYRQLNLLQDFSHLGTFDVVFCRNVLIYFDQDTKVDIFDRLSRMLEPDGFLALGAAESVVGITEPSSPIRSGAGSIVRTWRRRRAAASRRSD